MRRPLATRAARILAALLCMGVLGGATYAYTASNSVDATQAGDGDSDITGYTVTNVTYTQSALDPTLLASYQFDLDGPASTVHARPVSTQLVYDSCTNTVGTTWTCPATAGTTMLSLDNLRVIASQ
ncbi:MAG TPA: hypothetical protein VFK89_01425 [Actinomycetota bacterium]|nr:hypothetical protein [Actinomycetota bacterium]